MISMGLIRCTVIAALALGFAGGAHADDFPSRPITMIITFAAGGITDVVARIYADVASRNIGQRIIVDNDRPAAARSRPWPCRTRRPTATPCWFSPALSMLRFPPCNRSPTSR